MNYFDAYRGYRPIVWVDTESSLYTQWIDTGYRPAMRYKDAGDWRIEYESIFKPTKTVKAKKDTGVVAEDHTLDVAELL